MSNRTEAVYRAIAQEVTLGITYQVGSTVDLDVEHVVRPVIEAAVKAGIVEWTAGVERAPEDLIGVDVTLDGFAALTMRSCAGPNFIDVVRLDNGHLLTWSVDTARRIIAAGGAFKG